MAQHGHLTREQKKEIRIGRKKLRKDLRVQGITKRKEFEEIAQMLGLVYGDDYPRLLWLWWRFLGFLGQFGIRFYFGVCIAILAFILPFAILANQKGNFIVSMTDSLMEENFILSDDVEITREKVILKSDVLKEVNAYSIADMPDNLDQQSGSHNMDNVVAYTFWITNKGTQSAGYDWYLVQNNSTKNVENAAWVMLYDEGKMTIYARESQAGGPEQTTGYVEAPLYNQAADPQTQYRQEADGTYSVITTPYVENKIVALGAEDKLAPGESHKYTVVIWVEGDDPECSADIIGGHCGYAMRFTIPGDKEEIYEKYSYQSEEDTELREQYNTPVNKFLDDLKGKVKKD